MLQRRPGTAKLKKKKKKDSRNRNGVWLILAVKEFTRKVWVAHTVPRRLEKQAW